MPPTPHWLIPPTLIEHFGQRYELLFHLPEAQDPKNIEAFIKHKPKKVWVETHWPGAEGMLETLQTVMWLRDQGVSASVMFDIVHYLGGATFESQNFKKPMDEVIIWLEAIDKLIYKNVPLVEGIHFPINPNEMDTIPLDHMSKKQLERMVRAILSAVSLEAVVYENLQKFDTLPSYATAFKKTKMRRRSDQEHTAKKRRQLEGVGMPVWPA